MSSGGRPRCHSCCCSGSRLPLWFSYVLLWLEYGAKTQKFALETNWGLCRYQERVPRSAVAHGVSPTGSVHPPPAFLADNLLLCCQKHFSPSKGVYGCRHHLEVDWKCRVSGPALELLNQDVRDSKSSGNPYTHWSLRCPCPRSQPWARPFRTLPLTMCSFPLTSSALGHS